VIFFAKKSRNLVLAGAAAIFLIIVVWRYGQGGNLAAQTGFKSVNAQMEQLIDQRQSSAPSFTIKPSNTPTAQKSPKPDSTPKASKSESIATAKTSVKIDLNKATLEQLDALPGIGETKAKAILSYRQEKGSFTKVEQLLEIKGIGTKILAAIKSMIYIGTQ
jgi:competence protein ComEA